MNDDHWDFISTCRQINHDLKERLGVCHCCGRWVLEDDPCPYCGEWPESWTAPR